VLAADVLPVRVQFFTQQSPATGAPAPWADRGFAVTSTKWRAGSRSLHAPRALARFCSVRAASTPRGDGRYSALAEDRCRAPIRAAAALGASLHRVVEPGADQACRDLRNASGVPPTPPSPNAARTQRPVAVDRDLGRGATIAKSPWRTEISVKADPYVARTMPANDFLEYSPGRAFVAIGPAKEFLRLERARTAIERSAWRAPSTCATSGSSAQGSACASSADRAAFSRLNVTPPRERLAKQRHPRGERVVALDHALACASAGARHVLFDCE